MKMKDPSMPDLLVHVLLLLTTLLSVPAATSSAAGLTMRAELTHVDMGRGFTRRELISRMDARSRARVARLHQSRCGHPEAVPLVPISGEYLLHLHIGTPRPQRVELNMDTGSDLVWLQCTGCPVCFDQSFPMFDPSQSATFRMATCRDPICGPSPLVTTACTMGTPYCFYLCSYGDKSVSAGYINRDTFTFKATSSKGGPPLPVAVPELAFGCGDYNFGVFSSNESGIAGFGRGHQSLPSQLNVGKFSYCLTDLMGNKSSPVFLGMPDDLRAHSKGPIQSTPIVQNPTDTNYFLSLEGITVGNTRLPVDKSTFAIKKDGSGGTIIDSGTSFTHFPNAVVRLLKSAFVAQYPQPIRNDTSEEIGNRLCFQPPDAEEEKRVTVPKLIFHLAGADMDLPRENYMYLDPDVGALCLMITGTEGAGSIIGIFQQQNMHIVYDTDNNKLLFVPAQCDKL